MPVANTVEVNIIANFKDRLTGPSQKAFEQFRRHAQSVFRAVSASGVSAFEKIRAAQQSALKFNSGLGGLVPTNGSPLGLNLEPRFEVPSLASGVRFVPRDTLARKHKGDTVLSPSQSERISGRGSGGDNITFQISNGFTPDQATARKFARMMQDERIRINERRTS